MTPNLPGSLNPQLLALCGARLARPFSGALPAAAPLLPHLSPLPGLSLWGQAGRIRVSGPAPGRECWLGTGPHGAAEEWVRGRGTRSESLAAPQFEVEATGRWGAQLSSAALQASRPGHLSPAFPLSPSFPIPPTPCVHPVSKSGVAAHTHARSCGSARTGLPAVTAGTPTLGLRPRTRAEPGSRGQPRQRRPQRRPETTGARAQEASGVSESGQRSFSVQGTFPDVPGLDNTHVVALTHSFTLCAPPEKRRLGLEGFLEVVTEPTWTKLSPPPGWGRPRAL